MDQHWETKRFKGRFMSVGFGQMNLSLLGWGFNLISECVLDLTRTPYFLNLVYAKLTLGNKEPVHITRLFSSISH